MTLPDTPAEVQKVIGSYIKRAKELEQYQPVISYFAKLYSAQLILEGKYHLKSEDVANFTEALLNEIEEDKKELTESSEKIAGVIDDSEKGFKLVLGFSNVIFTGADKKVGDGKADKKAALDFKAACDFYQLLQLWNDLYDKNKELVEKRVKYSKYQCARILKAIRNGEDPNAGVDRSNVVENETDTASSIDENIVNRSNANQSKAVKENSSEPVVPDLPAPPSNLSAIKPDVSSYDAHSTSNVELPDAPKKIEGELDLPEAPVLIKGEKNHLGLPTVPIENNQDTTERSNQNEPLPGKDIGSNHRERPDSSYLAPMKSMSETEGSKKDDAKVTPTASPTSTTNAKNIFHSTAHHSISKEDVDKIWKQEEIIAQAQKRAKFAISALNYDDIPTAISELEKALNLLRAK